MANEKEKIIKKLGTPATITYQDGTTKDVKCLVSRAGHFNNSMLAVESHRKGDFMLGDNVTSGCIITNNITSETYLAVALYPSAYKDKYLSTVYRMVVTNATLNIKRDIQDADDNGNIINSEVDVVSDLPIYIEVVSQELKQYNPGLHREADYLIYAPSVEVDLLDKVTVNSGGRIVPLKVIADDFMTYPGVTLIEVKTETRK